MTEQEERELIDIVFDNKNRIENRVTKIVPPDGIKELTLSYNYKWNCWCVRFKILNGLFYYEYDIIDAGDEYVTYSANGAIDNSEAYGFRGRSENEMLKIVLKFTTEELNELADNNGKYKKK